MEWSHASASQACTLRVLLIEFLRDVRGFTNRSFTIVKGVEERSWSRFLINSLLKLRFLNYFHGNECCKYDSVRVPIICCRLLKRYLSYVQ